MSTYTLSNGTFLHLLKTEDKSIDYTFVDTSDLSDFKESKETLEAKRLGYKHSKKISGNYNVDDLTLELYATTQGYNKLMDLYKSDELATFALEYPSELSDLNKTFEANVTSVSISTKVDEIVKISATIEIDGDTVEKWTKTSELTE